MREVTPFLKFAHICDFSSFAIFMFTSFVCEQDRVPIDSSVDLTQLSAYFYSHGERCTAHQLHCSEEACSKLTT